MNYLCNMIMLLGLGYQLSPKVFVAPDFTWIIIDGECTSNGKHEVIIC